MASSRTAVAILALGSLLTLSACVVAPPRHYVAGAVWVAPPASRVEVVGTPPYPGYFWIAGYWRWAPRGYVWIRGHWAPPRAGFRWVARRWVHTRYGWRLGGGRWRRD